MEVIRVTPRGYCKGVVRAISLAKQAAETYPNEPKYALGMLVHNRYIVDALTALGIATLEDESMSRLELLQTIDHGVVIFTAHGIDPRCIALAYDKGLKVIDASCPDVLKTQELVKMKLTQGYEILYIGKPGHPEAEAVCSLSEHIHLLRDEHDIKNWNHNQKIFVTNQTTMSFQDVDEVFNAIKQMLPHAEFAQEICNATRIRQEAVAELTNIDCLFVVGDQASNNSNRLVQIAQANPSIQHVYQIGKAGDIKPEQILNRKRVAVTSGASTPTYLTNQVIEFLENEGNQAFLPTLDLSKML